LELEALPPSHQRRLASSSSDEAAEARQRYLRRNRSAYVARVAAAALQRFAPWAPRGGAADALATLAAAERQHAALRRLAAAPPAPAAPSSPLEVAHGEMISAADDDLEQVLETTSWGMQGHADLKAPAPQLVAGVGLALARAGAAEDQGLVPSALPPEFPEASSN